MQRILLVQHTFFQASGQRRRLRTHAPDHEVFPTLGGFGDAFHQVKDVESHLRAGTVRTA